MSWNLSAVYNEHLVEVFMPNYIRICSALAGALILAACAAGTADLKPGSNASKTAAQNPGCLSQTGSRITSTGTQCSAFGRSYSNEDIQRTGATTADDALRLMDPAITVHR
jgi:uncharacterized low-complexity protein